MTRPLNEQVVVITGASSGIGRVTARMLGARGARVVVASRNLSSLTEIAEEINQSGGQAVACQTDVSDSSQVQRLANTALAHFGRIDTWINNAGVSLYATFDKVSEAEARRIMDVNFMGTFHGMQAALPIMRGNGGGTIINTASVTGKRGIPLQTVYSASKYAIVGLGEAVRAELASDDSNINICTICPPSVDTPFFDHAMSKEGYAAKPMAPVYEPETVAEAIIGCAEDPKREVLIGAGGKAFALFNTLAPGVTDWFLGKTAISGQLSDEPKTVEDMSNLFDVPPNRREHGGWNALGMRKHSNGNGGGTGILNLIGRHPIATSAVGVAGLMLAKRYLFR